MNTDSGRPIYVVDTNPLIYLATWNPLEFKPEFWGLFEKALEDKKWVLLDVVVGEITHEGELKKWCKRQKDKGLVTVIDDEIRNLAVDINNKHKMINAETGNSDNDPFIVAFASKNGFGVFTRENHKTMEDGLFKIPDVCEVLKVPYTQSPRQFMKSIGFVSK